MEDKADAALGNAVEIVVARNDIVAVQGLQISDNAADIAVALEGTGNVVSANVADAVVPALACGRVTAEDAADLVVTFDRADHGTVFDRYPRSIGSGGGNVACAEDTAGQLAGGVHLAREDAIANDAVAHGLPLIACDTADIVASVDLRVADAVFNRAVERACEGADHVVILRIAGRAVRIAVAFAQLLGPFGEAAVITDDNARFHGAVANSNGVDTGCVAADEAGVLGVRSGFQRYVLDQDFVREGTGHVGVILHDTIAFDPLAENVQVFDRAVADRADHRLLAFGNGDGVAFAGLLVLQTVNMAFEGIHILAID